MRSFIIIALVLLTTGCNQRNSKVEKILKADGYTDIDVTGWRPFAGCSDQDTFSDRFKGTKNNQRVTGVVCAGWVKGATIRVITAEPIS